MKISGIVRSIDELGRIVVPKEIRRRLDINCGDPVEILVENDRIILTKHSSCCIFCQSDKDLMSFEGKKICKACVDLIKAR